MSRWKSPVYDQSGRFLSRAQLWKLIARKLQLHLICVIFSLLLCGSAGLILLVYKVHMIQYSQLNHRDLNQVVVISKSVDHHDTTHTTQTTTSIMKTTTTRYVPILVPIAINPQVKKSPVIIKSVQQKSPVIIERVERKLPDKKEDMPLPLIDTEQGMMDLDALFRRLVIVTAVSDNVNESMGMIASAQRYMPRTPIYLYNLGLKNKENTLLGSLCNVHIREIAFEKYPPHVKDLHTYSWKVIIIRETLKEFGAIFYGDSSVRFKGTLRSLFPLLHHHHGYMCHIHGFDPKIHQKIPHQYNYTYSDMYAELGVNRDEYYKSNKAAPHISTDRFLMVNNSVIWEKLLNPLNECAMRKQCIAPKGSSYGSHRFDASALAIVVYKNLRYEWTEDNNNSKELNEIVEIKRIEEEDRNVKICRKGHNLL